MTKTRVESFSDCVFAFAITLLVMGIQIPELKNVTDPLLRQALIAELPQLLPYITSFATIGIIWLNHHAMFHPVERVEHTTLTLNLLLLLVVAFIPYPTAVLSRYGALPSSAFFYGCVLTLLGLTYTLLWKHIARRKLSAESKDEHAVRRKTARNVIGLVTYPVATALALWHPRISVAIYMAIVVFYFVPDLHGARALPGPEGASTQQ